MLTDLELRACKFQITELYRQREAVGQYPTTLEIDDLLSDLRIEDLARMQALAESDRIVMVDYDPFASVNELVFRWLGNAQKRRPSVDVHGHPYDDSEDHDQGQYISR